MTVEPKVPLSNWGRDLKNRGQTLETPPPPHPPPPPPQSSNRQSQMEVPCCRLTLQTTQRKLAKECIDLAAEICTARLVSPVTMIMPAKSICVCLELLTLQAGLILFAEFTRQIQVSQTHLQFHFSVSAQDGIVALGKVHTRSAPSLSSLPKVALETVPIFSGWTQIVLGIGGWNVGRFLSPLLFPSRDQCCNDLPFPCPERSSSLGAPLPWQAVDQMWYLLCLPVYLPVHSHWLRRAQDSRSKEVFVAEDCMVVC